MPATKIAGLVVASDDDAFEDCPSARLLEKKEGKSEKWKVFF